MRQIVLDTETTGLEPEQGHRIIEIGCLELLHRRPTGRTFHYYLQPDREVEAAAMEVHGITNEFLADKPRFGDIAQDFIDFVQGAELVIHNAPFDVGFIDAELRRLGEAWQQLARYCEVVDTLAMARSMHPGQRNSLDALCKRYSIDNTQRDLHGALLDAQILADVYLAMTGGQAALSLGEDGDDGETLVHSTVRAVQAQRPLTVLRASDAELDAHEAFLRRLESSADDGCLWHRLQGE